MFTGSYTSLLDEKFRLTVPARFRLFLKGEEDRSGFFLSVEEAGDRRCLMLYPHSVWSRVVEMAQREAGEDPEARLRALVMEVEFCHLDAQGRILVPREMAARAGLAKEVVLVGVVKWIEAWSPPEWERERSRRQAERTHQAYRKRLLKFDER